jgi:hypothetical protein
MSDKFFCRECNMNRDRIPGCSVEVCAAIHKDAHLMERFRGLAKIGAAVMVQAFVQWAVYGCVACGALESGDCDKRNLRDSCQARAYYENFLSMKE